MKETNMAGVNCKEEEMLLFSTTIATQLTKGLSLSELEDLKILVGQIQCSICNLIALKFNSEKNDKH